MGARKSTIFWAVGIFLVLVVLFIYPIIKSSDKSGPSGYGAPCLVPNIPLLQHIHPDLVIEIDGKKETIPQNIGLGACERALHTHDNMGVIHVESQDKREYRLGDFFAVWGKPFLREGYSLEVTADGNLVNDPLNLIFKDGQHILMKYVRIINE